MNVNDLVKVITKDKVIEGVLMPSEKESLIIKLKNGYNIGINKKNIKKIELIEKYREKESKKISIKKKINLPTISILHTGGTVASRVSYETGAVSPVFSPEELINIFPELNEIANVKSKFIGNIWSQDMRFSHYNLIAKEISKEVKEGVNGIIVAHGTDTMHYTSAALAFILEDLPIPVLLVGSQRSSDRGSSDAGMNLICAANFIVKTDFAGVAICMHENMSDENCAVLPALKTRKMHTSRRDAFKAINDKPWAIVNYKNNDIKFLKKNYNKRNNKKLKLRLFNERIKVGIIKAHTNMFAEQFLFYKNYKGLVIESTGLGNLPTTMNDSLTKENAKIFNAVKLLINKGVIVVIAPGIIYGRINLNVYSNQRKMKEIGVLGDYSDMTVETAFIKLAWLLSNYKKDDVKKLIGENLRGEISERSGDEFIDY